ncbi:MAG: prepilin-type N-terminal cleavage/methylation domain-containing protein [Clostridiaceae bacterium]|nr:prepilin-type N-terminal cleavage/methylation domain-containing protein [Clostridiaceae bacterium]
MRKKGFTYIELMIAITIFTILILTIMKLNSTSQSNINKQINSQKMMFVAQKQMEKFKSTQPVEITVPFTVIDGYYVKLVSDNTPGGNIFRVTISVRKDLTSGTDEITLQGHVIKK